MVKSLRTGSSETTTTSGSSTGSGKTSKFFVVLLVALVVLAGLVLVKEEHFNQSWGDVATVANSASRNVESTSEASVVVVAAAAAAGASESTNLRGIADRLAQVEKELQQKKELLEQSQSQAQEQPAPASTTTSTTATSTITDNRPLLHKVATTYFAMDSETGQIQLPPEVNTIIIDVGARDSDYLAAVEALADPTVALFMVDPLPDSFIPLQQRMATYTMREMFEAERKLNPKFNNRVFVLRAAVGEEEGMTEFKLSSAGACGSILETAATNKFWCADTVGKMPVQIFTLRDLIDLIPQRDTITSWHLKVDTEGADLMALKGAQDRLERFATIVIECQNLPPTAENEGRFFRNGECNYPDAKEYMCSQHRICQSQFEGASYDATGERIKEGQGNVYFVNPNVPLVVPPFLQSPPIQFYLWYQRIVQEAAQAAAAAAAATVAVPQPPQA